jgi:hypothetical protein
MWIGMRIVGRELEPLAEVELLDRADEPDRALLDQIHERQPLVAVALGDRDDEAQIGLHHAVLGLEIAALDALGEVDLLGGGQQSRLCDAVEEELERIDRRIWGGSGGWHGGEATPVS